MRSFSLYTHPKIRILFHFLLWLLIYAFLLTICRTIFQIDKIMAPPVLAYSGITIMIIIFNHYFLLYFTLPLFLKKNNIWWIGVQLLLIYMLSAFISLDSISLVNRYFPGYPVLQALHKSYHISRLQDIFSYSTLSWFISYVLLFNIFSFLLKFAKKYYEANNDKISLLEEKNQMELNFLRSQIQPHFLFNTLNNIYGLVIDDHKASQAIIKLSDLLRFSLYESSLGPLSLEREISFLSDYILLEKMRHKDNKVSITFKFDDIENSSLKIKPLLLVNFIENAFKHGVNATINYSWVNISLIESKNVVTFTTINNKPKNIARSSNESTGVGLKNVRRRLELEYPERYDLSIRDTEELYEIKLTLKIDD